MTGGDDQNALRDFVEERIQPRVAAIEGVSQVLSTGGAPREVTIWIDPGPLRGFRHPAGARRRGSWRNPCGGCATSAAASRTAAAGRSCSTGGPAASRRSAISVSTPLGPCCSGTWPISRWASHAPSARSASTAARRRGSSSSRKKARISCGSAARCESASTSCARSSAPYGIDFAIGFDAAETVEEQLDRLQDLAVTGFLIALVVLFLFLREFRAVAVVAVAVPVSLLVAGAMLYLGGYTLNLITMLGLAVGIGALVDNSVVVYEAVQRGLERGLAADTAAISGSATDDARHRRRQRDPWHRVLARHLSRRGQHSCAARSSSSRSPLFFRCSLRCWSPSVSCRCSPKGSRLRPRWRG